MKRKHYLFINIIFFSLILFSAGVVYQFMTGNKPIEAIKRLGIKEKPLNVVTNNCSEQKPLQNLSENASSSLKRLATYQQACHSLATDTLMVFFSMPKTTAEAKTLAAQDAKVLQAFGAAKVRPLIIVEPTTITGENIDFALCANGTYNPMYDEYFRGLKAAGITAEQLGIINPFPEANLPYWENNQVQYFAPAVNNYLTIARQHYPTVKTSVLLNSATYELTDFNWENGDYNSLVPYVKGIKPGLIDYAGLQGFPWISRAGGRGVIFNGAEFLNPTLLMEMADTLKTKKIWFNTGTFSEKYTLDPEAKRTITVQQRKEILATIKEQAILSKQKGYEVAINIFAEDKSKQKEETNWSYWAKDQPFASTSTPLITEFIRELNKEDIEFWLFDR
jgi:hypothetical protein